MLPTIRQDTVQLSTARPIQLCQIDLIEDVHPHNHEFTELVLIQSGSIRHHSFDGAEIGRSDVLGSGNFVVIPPGPVHSYDLIAPEKECRLVNIYYLAEWFLWDLNLLWNEGLVPLFFASHLFRRAEMLRIWQFQLTEEEVRAIERELDDINKEYLQSRPSLLFVRGAFVKILVILARAWHRQTPQGDLHFRSEIWRALQAVDQCVKDGQVFRVDNFAREVGLATGSFSRLFHAATGLSPSEYFGRRRTQHAAHLLLESDLAVGEIAARLGFCDSAHLSRAFLKNERFSPRAFRARYRVGN